MDVRCPQCNTEYSVTNIPVEGFPIRCTVCGFKFRVAQQVTVVAESQAAKLGGGIDQMQLQQGKWVLRRADGQLMYFKELTTLQRWIVEGRVSEGDQISKGGQNWKRLGDMVELASFFQVVRNLPQGPRVPTPIPGTMGKMPQLDRGKSSNETIAPTAGMRPVGPPVGPPGPTMMSPPQGAGQRLHGRQPGYGGPDDNRPTLIMGDSPFALDEFDDEFTVGKKGGAGKYIALGLIGSIVVAAAVMFFFFRPTLAGWFPDLFGGKGGTEIKSQVDNDGPKPDPRLKKPIPIVVKTVVDATAPIDAGTPGPTALNKADTTLGTDVKRVVQADTSAPTNPTADIVAVVPDTSAPVAKKPVPPVKPGPPLTKWQLLALKKKQEREKRRLEREKRRLEREKKQKELALQKKQQREKRRLEREKRRKERDKKPGGKKKDPQEKNLRGYAALLDKGKKYLQKGQPNTALNFFFKAHMSNKGSTQPLMLLARTYNRLGSPASAIVYYKKALAISSRSLGAIYGIAAAYMRTGNKSMAVKYYRKYLQISPTGPRAKKIKSKLEAMGF